MKPIKPVWFYNLSKTLNMFKLRNKKQLSNGEKARTTI